MLLFSWVSLFVHRVDGSNDADISLDIVAQRTITVVLAVNLPLAIAQEGTNIDASTRDAGVIIGRILNRRKSHFGYFCKAYGGYHRLAGTSLMRVTSRIKSRCNGHGIALCHTTFEENQM